MEVLLWCIKIGTVPGAYQVEWVPTDSLASKSVFPEEVRDKVVTTF